MKSRAISATLWSGADIFLRQGLQFVVSIVLARLLSPEEFGTIALLYLFTGLASAFVDCGLSAALIQRQDITRTDESTVFWFNLAMGAIVALALWGAAPAIAVLYKLPILAPLTAVMALNIVLGALGSIHGILLTKRLDFRTQMKVGAITTLISGSAAIYMAMNGYGVWTLAAQTVVATSATTALLWVFNPWRPALVFSLVSARRLFAFGGYMLVSGLLDTAYNRMYSLLIGIFYSVRELGLYNRADSMKQLPSGMLTSILGRVAFPIFSAAASDKVQLRRGFQLALRGMMLINVPMMLGMAAVAEPLVLTLFGDKWLPAVTAMQVLCLGGILWPLHVINLNVLMAQGHSNLFFRLEVTKKLLGMALLAVGTFYGVMGIAWSQVVFNVLGFAVNAHYTKRHLNYGAVAQTLDFLPTLVITIIMALSIHWGRAQIKMDPAWELIILSTTGALIFLVLSWIFHLAALQDALDLLRHPKSTKHQLQQTK